MRAITYSFLIDETDSEFLYEQYYSQLISGDRVPRSPEQWVQAKNILLKAIKKGLTRKMLVRLIGNKKVEIFVEKLKPLGSLD